MAKSPNKLSASEAILRMSQKRLKARDLVEACLDRIEQREGQVHAWEALDADGARKRADKDRREAENYGGSRLARDLLPVYDALSRALDSAGDDQRAAAAALIEGVELTLRELTNVMTKHGVTPVSPAVGDVFDPQLHQAMFEAPLPGTKAGQIIQVATEGFLLHDRLLRPAQVGVSSTPAA